MTTNERELVERYDWDEFEVLTSSITRSYDVYKKHKRVTVFVDNRNIGDGYWAVRFKIENWDGRVAVFGEGGRFGWYGVRVGGIRLRTASHPYLTIEDTRCPLYIGQDAKDKWSTPVIFNREQKDKLHDLVKYLEEKLNAPS